MRNKNTSFLILALLISACAGSNSPAPDDGRLLSKSVETILLENFPARSALESQALAERLLAFGAPGIAEICSLLQAGGDLQTKAEFALSMLANAVIRPEHLEASGRKMLVRALGNALRGNLTPENKAFLIAQLQLAGNDNAVPILGEFLHTSRLADPAIRALTTIGTPKAEKALVTAYEKANRDQKLALLQAYGTLQGKMAREILQREAASENSEIAAVAQSILADLTADAEQRRGMIGDENADAGKIMSLQAFEKRLRSGDADVRLETVEKLMYTGDTAAVDILLLRLQATSESQEILAIEKALLHLPIHKNFAALVSALPKSSDPARAALLHVLVERYAEAYKGEFLAITLTDSSQNVRLAAIKGLAAFGTASMLPQIPDGLLASSNLTEQMALSHAFAAIAKREDAVVDATDLLLDRFQRAETPQKKMLLEAMGNVGGQKALTAVVAASKYENTDVRDTAIRELADWKEPAALPFLLKIAGEVEDLTHHVLVLRGCARLMANDSLTTAEKIRVFDHGMAIARRVEEKKMFLASLQQVRSPLALKRAAEYVSDADIGFEAALTVAKMTESETDSDGSFSQQDVAFALLENQLTPEVKSQLRDYLDAQVEHNRPPEGFAALFNGFDLTGWKGLVKNPVERAKISPEELAREQTIADSIMRAHWFVENGVLKFDGTKFYNICTNKDFGDFELLLDWKIEKEGDSGIYLRGTPQVQIWDPDRPDAGVGSGGLYNNQKHPSTPLVRADRLVGEWNTFRIVMIGEKVTVYLNDVLVVGDVVLENYWQRDRPIYASDQIELQAHNSPLYFRNIFIREIPRQAAAFDGDLFDGKDLTGWQIIEGQEGGWGVKGGILFTSGKGGGWLSTTREFDNFKLELEFRVSKGGNSGVFLRAPHQGDPAYTGMEIQVLDDFAGKYATLKSWQYTGSIYAVQPPSVRAAKNAGEWQKMQIVCDGPKVQVTLNGVKIIDTNLVAHGDKTKRNPGLKRRKGFIGLQNHGSLVEYRNIHLVELR